MEKIGWIMHYVFDEIFEIDEMNTAGYINIHTHGIFEELGHADIQIVVRLPQEIAHSLMWTIYKLIKEGKTFKAGDISSDILHGYNVAFINAIENKRRVLRVILPDKNGKMEGQFSYQISDCIQYNEVELLEHITNFNYKN